MGSTIKSLRMVGIGDLAMIPNWSLLMIKVSLDTWLPNQRLYFLSTLATRCGQAFGLWSERGVLSHLAVLSQNKNS